MGDNAITSMYLFVCFHSNFWIEWPWPFCMCMGHGHSFPGIEGQDQRSMSNFKSQGQRLKRGQWEGPRSSIEDSFLLAAVSCDNRWQWLTRWTLLLVRCSGCEMLIQNLEEQVLKANMRQERQIQLNKDMEQEVMTAMWLLQLLVWLCSIISKTLHHCYSVNSPYYILMWLSTRWSIP